LNEENVKLIRQMVKEAVYEILETEFYDAFFNLLDAFEAGIASFKRQLGSRKGVVAAVKEETFTCLKFEQQKGNRLGEFEVAVKDKNPEAQWLHAYNILKQANATINNRYHGEGYAYSYWLFDEGKIYRQKLKQKT
jgi:hypothetical protein